MLLRIAPDTAAEDELCEGYADLPPSDVWLRAGLTTIDELRLRGARVVLIGDRASAGLSMKPVADRLSRLAGASVPLVPAVAGSWPLEPIEQLLPGEMLMLENLLAIPGESWGDPALALALSDLADFYVNDAFALAHTRRASTWGVAQHLPSAAGRLFEHEVHALTAVIDEPARPLVVLLGGTGLAARASMVRRMLLTADVVCLGGAVATCFLAARGCTVGEAVCPPADLDAARSLLATERTALLLLPSDLLIASAAEASRAAPRRLPGVDVPAGWSAMDIGHQTSVRYTRELMRAATVLWHGPMGLVEQPAYRAGTLAVASGVASVSATTIVAGAATAQALRALDLDSDVGHVSAGGPAMLTLLAGGELPGIDVLVRDGARPASRERAA